MAGASTPASPEPAARHPVAAHSNSGPGPATRIHIRSAHPGGRAIGAWLVGWRRTFGPIVCQCCYCRIPTGAVVFDVDTGRDVLVVCEYCAGPE